MARLTGLLKSKSLQAHGTSEENVEVGKINVFYPGRTCTGINSDNGFCYVFREAGTAVIEIWGASGSSSRMCCCGYGLPGNAGGYSKKTINVVPGNLICGQLGQACSQSDGLCSRGCSNCTAICWYGLDKLGNTNGCMCASGGHSGRSFCTTTPSAVCCFGANGFCVTLIPDNCGIVCNWGSTVTWMGCGYGGDVNCCGGFSCQRFMGCLSGCNCAMYGIINTSPGVISAEGASLTFSYDHNSGMGQWAGQGYAQAMAALGGASRFPSAGVPLSTCWGAHGMCGCYENTACVRPFPYGMPAPGVTPCDQVRDQGYTGGDGAVRIRFT
jgi:hypothetical protein